jgi:hypothetical protein
MTPLNYTRAQALPEILNARIAILDGAMGTMIQRFKLSESDYRGERFKDFPKDVKGNNELLSLTPATSSPPPTSPALWSALWAPRPRPPASAPT